LDLVLADEDEKWGGAGRLLEKEELVLLFLLLLLSFLVVVLVEVLVGGQEGFVSPSSPPSFKEDDGRVVACRRTVDHVGDDGADDRLLLEEATAILVVGPFNEETRKARAFFGRHSSKEDISRRRYPIVVKAFLLALCGLVLDSASGGSV